MDPKVTYIAKTLSRTKRKDYENYVVNAIWNRVNNAGLVPVTQQYVRDRDGNRFFIDMYFPQLKIGIECDEGYHTDKDQKIRDAERELTINDVLTQVDGGDYIALHVDVTRSFDEVEAQINAHAETINRKIEALNIGDGWKQVEFCGISGADRKKVDGETDDFVEASIRDYFRDKEYITISDNITFPSNKEVYNVILGQNFKYHLMHGGEPFHKLYTEYGYEEGTFPWFPKLTVKKPTVKGYYNILSKDAEEIYEYIDDPKKNMQRKAEGRYIGKKRVVFAQVKDPVTGSLGYRFVGFFTGDHYDENGVITYRRIDDKFRIIKKDNN